MAIIYGLRLSLTELIQSKQIGESIDLVFCRDGKLMTAKATVAVNEPIFQHARLFDKPPRYVCFAGLVFVSASAQLSGNLGTRLARGDSVLSPLSVRSF